MENNLRVYSWNDIVSGNFFSRHQLLERGYEGTALTVGGFDGAHVGHQALFDAVLGQKNLLPGVITFGISPKARLNPESFSGSVYTMEQRLQCFQEAGFAFVVVIDFSGDFGRMDGVTFLQHLKNQLHMSFLAEGTDFRCGYKGAVNIDFLRDFAQQNGLVLEVVDPVIVDGVRVSSSQIRNSLLQGDFSRCRLFLGRNFALGGNCFQWQWKENSFVGMRTQAPCGCLQILPPAGSYQVTVHCKIQSKDASIEKVVSFVEKAIIQDESLKIPLPKEILEDLSDRMIDTERVLVDSVEFTC